MAKLTWDDVGSRFYETGVDHGVLYLPDGSGVAWSGLTEIAEKEEVDVTPVYFDGRKIMDSVILGDYSATLKAITYPDEFLQFEGVASLAPGSYIPGQDPKPFGLSYRTLLGNDVRGNDAGYKLHIVYNLMAVVQDQSYSSLDSGVPLSEFAWDLSAIPEEASTFRPTAHVVIDSRDADPWFLDDLEATLYGTGATDPSLMSLTELIAYAEGWYRITVVDNGDGTWTATSSHEFFTLSGVGGSEFVIPDVNAVYTAPDTYLFSDTYDISDV